MEDEIKLFKALSDGTRLRIMVLLAKQELCVCQLEWAMNLTQAKVSRHLAVLKGAGLIKDRREGLWSFYSLAKAKNELERVFHKYLKNYFIKEHNLFKKDIMNMKKCTLKPLHKLTTRRR